MVERGRLAESGRPFRRLIVLGSEAERAALSMTPCYGRAFFCPEDLFLGAALPFAKFCILRTLQMGAN